MGQTLVPDGLWGIVEPLIPPQVQRPQGGGTRYVEDRAVFTAIVYVLTTGCGWRHLPEDTPLPELVRLGKIRWRVEHDYRELKTGLGLDHFEGRTWTGWHRHVTLVTAAQLFLTSLRHDPKVLVSA